jgi:tetratricopeptide (TPR) repeat protein
MIKNTGCKSVRVAMLVFLSLAFCAGTSPAADTPADTPASPATNSLSAEGAATQELLRSYLHVQEQLRGTQLAIEQSRQEAQAAAIRNAELIEARLALFEKSLASQRLDELKEMQTSNRMILNTLGIFALIAFVVLSFTAFLLWSAVNRLTAVAAASPPAQPLGTSLPALGLGDAPLTGGGSLEESTKRFLGTIERLEHRVHEMEHALAPQPALPEAGSPNGHGHGQPVPPQPPASRPAVPPSPADAEKQAAVDSLLGKGETLLKLDQPQDALALFQEASTLDPTNAEALVRQGVALERLQRLDEAIACYDRAIIADSSMTMAYLYKGAVFNRLERFSEALECYERALKAQEKVTASKVMVE